MISQTTLYKKYFKYVKLPYLERRQQTLARKIKTRGVARVAFIVSSLSMWRGDYFFELLQKDSRFDPIILLLPFDSFQVVEQVKCINQLKNHFDSNQIPYIDLSGLEHPGTFLRGEINPDIIFYPQPYFSLYNNNLDSHCFEDKLLCYIPYSLNTISEPWPFNQRFNNVAWLLFYSSPDDIICARDVTFNNAKNVRVVGNALADYFLKGKYESVWKPQEKLKKKVIWAPHFSITKGGLLNRDSFTSISRAMQALAQRYQETIQFAFKPHPRLKSILYQSSEWGQEKTDEYYQFWAEASNTQLETGGYIDLFMTSDAMIHDCASFTAEYHYSGHPVLFFTKNREKTRNALNEIGKAAFDAHYFGESVLDIQSFLDIVLLQGKDLLKNKREEFFRQHLLPPNRTSTAHNIYRELILSLGFEE